MNLLCRLADKGTYLRHCWIPSHSDIRGSGLADQITNDALVKLTLCATPGATYLSAWFGYKINAYTLCMYLQFMNTWL